MKKLILSFIFLLSFLTILSAQNLMLSGVSYTVDTLENHQVGPGTHYVSLRLMGNNRLDVYFLKTDLKNQHIQIHTALGHDSIYTGERPSAVAKRKSREGAQYFAGTNGDFYSTTGYVGYPGGGHMIGGEITKIPKSNRKVFLLDDMKRPEIGLASYSGLLKFNDEEWVINSLNHLRGEDQLLLYNQYNGKYTRTNKYGTEALIELLDGYTWGTNKTLRARVLKVEKGVGSMAIPKGKAVLSGHGIAQANLNKLKENDEIEFNLGISINNNNTSNFQVMTGGDGRTIMLKDGVVATEGVWADRHPRTGLGYTQNRDSLIFCVVDGRGVSAGVSTRDLAELMKSAGAYTAFNMDGGGSSCMYIAEYDGPVNKNSDPGGERATSNSIFVVSTAPTDNNVAIIKPHESTYQLPYLGEYSPKFYAYNQYGVLLSSDLQDIVLTCPPSLGKIEGNKFIATGNTSGQITATYNGSVATKINIDFLPVSGIKIRLDSILTDNRRDYPIEVLATTSAGDALIAPSAFTWEVEDSEICTVENGVVKALKNGSTVLTGKINDVSDQITINVEIPSAAVIIGDSLKNDEWKLNASRFLKANLNTDNLPAHWNTGSAINFVYNIGRAPFMNLTHKKEFYGLPDTIKVTMNVGDVALSRAIFTFKNNLSESSSIEFNDFEKNQDITLNIPVDQLFNVNDRAIYPISFDNVKFYLNTDEMTVGKSYSLGIKEIALAYKDIEISGIRHKSSALFGVYPNPVGKGNELIIRLPETNLGDDVHLRLFDLSGKQIKTLKLANIQSNTFSFSLSGVETGTYLMQLTNGNRNQTLKIVVR